MNKTRKNQKLSRAVLTRVVMAVLLLAMVGGVLTSCGGSSSSSQITTIKKGYAIGENLITEENGLSAAQLDKLADEIVESDSALTVREQLVAALRGYDMNAADFDDTKVSMPGDTPEDAIEAHPENAPTYAMTALKKANIETFPYLDAEGNTVMTVADVQALVDCFRITVTTDEELGFLQQILHWIGLGFEWLIKVPGFGSFILGTLYFAIILELLMLPLGINQQRNSRKQARLRPKEMAIRNKYKGRNDQATMQKLNEEIQNLYAKEGYSPMSGCLPLLISMLVLIPLYYIVIDPLKYMMGAGSELSSAFLTFAGASRAAGGLGLSVSSSRGTIEVLSLIREGGLSLDGLADFAYFTNGTECLAALDGMVERIPDFTLFGLNMGLAPGFDSKEQMYLLFMPVLTFLVYWGSGKISRKFTFQPMQDQAQNDPAQGCSNSMMNIMMPAMSAWFTLMVPAAVGLYWMFKSVVSTIKQIVLYKVMPLPTFTEEDYKAAERELAGKDKSKPAKKSGTRNPNVRSLHHIDDEDYETSAPIDHKKAANKPDYVEPEEEPAKPRTAEGAYGGGATLKEDRPETDQPAKSKKKLFGKKNKDE